MAAWEVGDVYPLRVGYDTQGRKTNSLTTRDAGATWDETRWEYDTASGLNTAKVYADGSRITYAYAADGKKTRTTWARGAWKENNYNERRLVSGMTYSDETPSVTYEYDAARKMFAESLTRSKAHRELITHRVYSFDGRSICQYTTGYDILGRPTNAVDSISSARAWVYNRRSELAAAMLGTNCFGYAYDTIGNRLTATANVSTNTYSANNLNQYSSILCDSAALREAKTPTYDADGNLISDGSFSYSYDAENRLVYVLPLSPANGSFAIENRYDHRHRRTQKVVSRFADGEWAWAGTHIYVWDGNNIVLERIAFADGTERVCEYFWGLDKSGTEQGAGGVGGLLAVSVDGAFCLPCYDHNGNIVAYVSEAGDIAAQFVYDPYGNVIEQYGAQASQFFFGFSTKIHDREIGLVAYQRRFYSPDLGRWLNRDPIEELGGENLYAFCANDPVSRWNRLGCDWSFSTPVWDEMTEELDFTVKYTMSESERKCCKRVTVDRYVKKFLGIGGTWGSYELDHTAGGGMNDITQPYVGYAEADSPDGQTLYLYRLPWTQSFKWEARCTAGPNKGKILSTVERQFKTSGHWLWSPKREGRFL